MDTRTILPVFLVLVLLAPVAQGVSIPYPKPADSDAITVDLKADAGGTLDWAVDVKEAMDGGCLAGLSKHSDASSAVAKLTLRVSSGTATVLDLGLVRNTVYTETAPNTFESNTVFKGALSVDTLKLVEGTWDLSLTVADRFGASHDCTDERTVEATADDDESPVVTFPSADEDGVVRLHAGQGLQPVVTDDLLGTVEYRVDRMPAGKFFALKAPFLVDSKSFFPGENTLTLRVSDRAGNPVTVETVKVLKDDVEPELSVSFPRGDTFYVGAFVPINITVADHNDYTLVLRLQGEQTSMTGDGGFETDFQVAFSGEFVGQSQLVVTATDTFGNMAQFARLVNVTQLSSPARMTELTVTEKAPIVGEDVHLVATLEQVDGLAAVNFTLLMDRLELGSLQVPEDDENTTTLVVRNLLPGTHDLVVTAQADPEVVLLDERNLTRVASVEVFLARVHVGDEVYHIRPDARSLPNAAVDENGTAYPLVLQESGKGSVYAWKVGDKTYVFDPSKSRDQEFAANEAPSGAGDGEDAPGFGPVLALLALAGAAALVRRRT